MEAKEKTAPFRPNESLKTAPFRPKKSLNMQQLFEDMKLQMEQLLGSQPGDVIPVGFRIYALDTKQHFLSGQSFLSKGIHLESFGSEDQAVKIDPSLPDDEKQLLLRSSAILYALLEGIRTQDSHALEACRALWDEAKSAREVAPTIENILWTLYEAMDHHKDWDSLESEKDSLESDLEEKQSELDDALEKIEELQARITELEEEKE